MLSVSIVYFLKVWKEMNGCPGVKWSKFCSTSNFRYGYFCRVFTTVMNGIGDRFTPTKSPAITEEYVTKVRMMFKKGFFVLNNNGTTIPLL